MAIEHVRSGARSKHRLSHIEPESGGSGWFFVVAAFLLFVLAVVWWRSERVFKALPGPRRGRLPQPAKERHIDRATPGSKARPVHAVPSPSGIPEGSELKVQPKPANEQPVSTTSDGLAIGNPDDLTVIKGIGRKVAGLLVQAGIASFQRLSETDVERLHEILRAAGLPMLDPSSWPAQARLAVQGDFEAVRRFRTDRDLREKSAP